MLTLPDTAFLAPDVDVWLVYSGSRRRFFDDFIEHSAVFLDLPGFGGVIDTFTDTGALRRHIRMSDSIRDYYRGHREDHPGRNVRAFSSDAANAKTPEGRRFNAEVGNALRMYRDAKVGDVILSPPLGHYDPFLVGRITSEWTPDQVRYSRYYSEDPVPVREVEWIESRVSRRDFPRGIAKSLQNPHAISQVEFDLYFEIFISCFDSFVWRDRSKLDVFGNTYSSHDPLETYEAAFVIKYLASAYAAYEAGKIEDFNSLEPMAAVAAYFDKSLIIEFRQNFNSPGKFALAAAAAAMSLSIAGGVVMLSGSGSPGSSAAQDQIDLKIAPHDPEIAEKVSGFVRAISQENVKKLDEQYGIQAREKIGMSLKRTQVAREAVE